MNVRWTIYAAPLFFAGAAFAASIQSAVDLDPSGLVPGPLSSALETSFRGGLGSSRTVDFESLTPGFVSNFSPASGVNIALTNVSPVFDTVSTDNDQYRGFNTTPAGSQFLQLNYDSDIPAPQPDLLAHFSFSNPISAFGFYLTGAGSTVGRSQLEFTDGDGLHIVQLSLSSQYPDSSVIYVAVNGLNGSIQDFYFRILNDLDDNQELTIGDIMGIDDITFQEDATVPEPSTVALAAAGGLALWLARRKR